MCNNCSTETSERIRGLLRDHGFNDDLIDILDKNFIVLEQKDTQEQSDYDTKTYRILVSHSSPGKNNGVGQVINADDCPKKDTIELNTYLKNHLNLLDGLGKLKTGTYHCWIEDNRGEKVSEPVSAKVGPLAEQD